MSVAQKSISLPYGPKLEFFPVSSQHPNQLDEMKAIFQRIVEPILGSQEKNLNKIALNKDRRSYLLYENGRSVGALIFKRTLSDKHQAHGVTQSLKIKFLLITQAPQFAGWNVGSTLLDKVEEEVQQLSPRPKSIHLNVNVEHHQSLRFFQNHGFRIVTHLKKEGSQEALLVRTFDKAVDAGNREKLKNFSDSSLEYRLPRKPPELLYTIQNAHLDDIHSLKKLGSNTYVSGSKDNCLYMWNTLGERVRVVQEVEPLEQNEKNWITAIAKINNRYWVSGERSGKVRLWTSRGDHVHDLHFKFPKNSKHQSHEFNKRRVNCMTSYSDETLLIGAPTFFNEYSLMERRTKTLTKVHANDWVYCLQTLSDQSVVAAVGATLNRWKKEGDIWEHQEDLIEEKKVSTKRGEPKPERNYISSAVPLKLPVESLGITNFAGEISILDVAQKEISRTWQGHQGKAWLIEPISEHLFASGGEDRTVMLWDERVSIPVDTIEDHVGQVTSLVAFDERLLIAGTCPENPEGGMKAGELRYYDIRL